MLATTIKFDVYIHARGLRALYMFTREKCVGFLLRESSGSLIISGEKEAPSDFINVRAGMA